MNLYARLPAIQAALNAQGVTAGTSVNDMLRVLGEASEFARNHTKRIFHTETRTVLLNGNGETKLWLQLATNEPFRTDLVSVTSVKLDEDLDDTYELELTEDADFWLWPSNPTVTHRPARALEILGRSPQRSVWPVGQRNIQVVGKWGHSEITEDSGLTGTVADATTETITADDWGTDIIFEGDTLLIESEQVYVTASPQSTSLAVKRGVNGTTAAAHTDKPVLIRRYPEDLERAVASDAARQFWWAAGGYDGNSRFSERWPAIRDALGHYSGVTVAF